MSKEVGELLSTIEQNTIVQIRGIRHTPIAKVIYVAQSSPDTIYGKVFFEDHKVLVICPDEDYLSYGQDLGNIGSDLPGNSSFVYEDRTYRLLTSDYQIVTDFEFGNPNRIEGEVEFWEYEAQDDPTHVISLGVIKRTGTRADVVAEILLPGEIELE